VNILLVMYTSAPGVHEVPAKITGCECAGRSRRLLPVGIVISAVTYFFLARGTVTDERKFLLAELHTEPTMVSSFETPGTKTLAPE
jgi:hypothetical protein